MAVLVAVFLIAAQGLAFAHGIDEASHPAQNICDLCIAGHSLGAATGGSDHSGLSHCRSGSGPLPEFRSLTLEHHFVSPTQRGPPLSR